MTTTEAIVMVREQVQEKVNGVYISYESGHPISGTPGCVYVEGWGSTEDGERVSYSATVHVCGSAPVVEDLRLHDSKSDPFEGLA